MTSKIDNNNINRNLINDVVSKYSDRDIISLVRDRIQKENYIEAYAIADQYIAEMVSRLLIVKEGELNEIRENINIKKTLDLMFRVGNVKSLKLDYINLISKFKKIRNRLVHNSIYSKLIFITKELKSLPLIVILETEIFYFTTSLDLITLNFEIMQEGKEKIFEKYNFNREKLRFFIDFILNLHKISQKKNNNYDEKKDMEDFSTFIARILGEIFPSYEEKKLGVKRDSKEFIDYVLKLIKRDLDLHSLYH